MGDTLLEILYKIKSYFLVKYLAKPLCLIMIWLLKHTVEEILNWLDISFGGNGNGLVLCKILPFNVDYA